MKRTIMIPLLASLSLWAQSGEGERLFKAYCWGCHHQTAQAFGPSFSEIASKRSREEIMAQIVDPAAVSKTLGYSRSSMPAFDDLNATQIGQLADFILSFKPRKEHP